MTKVQMRHIYEMGLDLLPLHMHEGVRGHIEHGRAAGGFLTALLEGDAMAFGRADPVNAEAHGEWEVFLANHMPAECWGTPAKVSAWRKMGGFDGYPDGAPADQ